MFFWHALVKPTGSKRSFIEAGINFFVVLSIAFSIYISLAPESHLIILSEFYSENEYSLQFLDPETVQFLLVIALFLSLNTIDMLLTLKRLNWKKLTSRYPFKGDKKKLDFTRNVIEYNGYISSISNSIAMDESGIYFVPNFLDKLIYSPIFIEWSHLTISTETYRLSSFGIPFGKEKEIMVIETKYEKGYRLRIRKGELKIDYERALLERAN
ncbi:MAG: hypothetical protein ED557_09095 [Balneola sp.]|nr:MAG: hypothetical protein ED557_09095 [Balneola sp.]